MKGSLQPSPLRSARNHAIALRLFYQSVSKILHRNGKCIHISLHSQQDGATVQIPSQPLVLVRKMCPGHVFYYRGDIGWPTRSLDLTPDIVESR